MGEKFFSIFKSRPKQALGTVSLSIDDVDVIAEALSVYEAGLVGKRFGYFSNAARSAKTKIQAIYPDLFQQFTSSR